MKRKEGYYWVRHENDWEVMWWNNFKWLSVWEMDYQDNELQQINETPIPPPTN
jgi:hypothetical protein